MAWLARNGDDEVDDDIVGQQVEEMPAVDESGQSVLDDPEERVHGTEVVRGLNQSIRSVLLALSPTGSQLCQMVNVAPGYGRQHLSVIYNAQCGGQPQR